MKLFAILSFFLLCSACSSSDTIDVVKNGYLVEIDETVTIGDAFDSYPFFSDKKWTVFQDNKKRNFAVFEAEIDLEKIARSRIKEFEKFSQYTDELFKSGSPVFSSVRKVKFYFFISKDLNEFQLAQIDEDNNGNIKSITLPQQLSMKMRGIYSDHIIEDKIITECSDFLTLIEFEKSKNLEFLGQWTGTCSITHTIDGYRNTCRGTIQMYVKHIDKDSITYSLDILSEEKCNTVLNYDEITLKYNLQKPIQLAYDTNDKNYRYWYIRYKNNYSQIDFGIPGKANFDFKPEEYNGSLVIEASINHANFLNE